MSSHLWHWIESCMLWFLFVYSFISLFMNKSDSKYKSCLSREICKFDIKISYFTFSATLKKKLLQILKQTYNRSFFFIHFYFSRKYPHSLILTYIPIFLHPKFESIFKTLANKTRTIKEALMTLSSEQMDLAIRVQIWEKTVCISHSTNILKKGMYPTILPLAVGK